MQTLDVISVNLWQILASLLNLVLLFLIVKYFFYKPVKKMLEARRATIDGQYEAADNAKKEALARKAEYEDRLAGARSEADGIIKKAVDTAALREREMMDEAQKKAYGIVKRAEEDAVLEKKKAEEDIRRYIVEVSTLVSEKVLEREMTDADHEKLIDNFIDSIGDTNEAD